MKYKIGTLVTLSAAGMKNDHNCGFYTGFGIVMDCVKHHSFPYKLRWFNEEKVNAEFTAKEYELKRYKNKS